MKKKKSSTPKAKAKTAKPRQSQNLEMPSLVDALSKLTERIGSLENKVAALVQQQAPRHSQQQQQHQHQRPQHQQAPSKTLYQAVCADCSKSCEVPFKATGDRPVYCKECWTARKASRRQEHQQPSPQEQYQKRQIRVTPNGGGRIVVSEMVKLPRGKEQGRGRTSRRA